jgi:adenylate cyclase class IV
MKIDQEFETKFETTLSVADIERQLGVVFEAGKRQRDVYYDRPNADLFLRGVFLRIRDERAFQIKVNLDDYAAGRSSGHTQCTELEAPLSFGALERSALAPVLDAVGLTLGEAADCFGIFAANNLSESVVIAKTRHSARTKWGSVYFDSVEGLGDYIEIEAADRHLFEHASAEFAQAVEGWVSEGSMIPIDTGYNALFWRKKDFGIYIKCPYLLKKDRIALG